MTPLTDIVFTLRRQLHERGINLLQDIKIGWSNLQISCPIHSDGQERRPSCGIRITPGGGSPVGWVHCFTCGYSVPFEEMVSNCFGYDDWGEYGRQWIIQNFVTVSVENRGDLGLDMERKKGKEDPKYITEEELQSYRWFHPYMWQRHLTEEAIGFYDVGYDKAEDALTFPVRDEHGNVLFIGRRKVKGKFFHYPNSVKKSLYGVYEALNKWPHPEVEIIICESAIDVLTCYGYGRLALGLMGTGNKEQYKQLEKLYFRKYILAFDGDDAGRRAEERFRKNVKGKIITSYVLPDSSDINDLTKEEFENLQEHF